MGNYWRKLTTYGEDQFVIWQLIELLGRVIQNRVSPNTNRTAEMEQLENLLQEVRSTSTRIDWEVIVQDTLCLSSFPLSDTFAKIVTELTKGSLHVTAGHVITLYALFIDVVTFCVQNNISVNISDELRRLHDVIHHTLGISVLHQALITIRTF